MDRGIGSAVLNKSILSTKTSISPVDKSGLIKSFSLAETLPDT